MRLLRIFFSAAVLGLVLAWQQASAGEGLKVEQLWARASLAGVRNGIVYGRLADGGTVTVELVSASTPVADHVEFHEHSMVAGVMTMRPLDGIKVEPGEVVTLQPGGMHMMLVDLKRPLTAGQSFPLTLKLADGDSMTVAVSVLSATATAP
ncbi:MAG TPA: copper chaperone PCu(A)C [Candidatus Udaeobacter sp.]|nr:copper chaperone PCu(A)C [Candidatus Udaeobacter sp.]